MVTPVKLMEVLKTGFNFKKGDEAGDGIKEIVKDLHPLKAGADEHLGEFKILGSPTKWSICCENDGKGVRCRLYEDAERKRKTLDFLLNQERREVEVFGELSRVISLESEGVKKETEA